MKILTTGIYWIFRGLEFETDGIGFAFHRAGAEIGQKGTLCKGLNVSSCEGPRYSLTLPLSLSISSLASTNSSVVSLNRSARISANDLYKTE